MGFSTGVSINAGTGEANGGTSLGAGEGVFVDKVGTDLRFKSLVAGTDISLVSDANTITINSTASGGGDVRNIVRSTDVTSGGVNYSAGTYQTVTNASVTINKTVVNSYLKVSFVPDGRGLNPPHTCIFKKLNAAGTLASGQLEANGAGDIVQHTVSMVSTADFNDLRYENSFEFIMGDQASVGNHTIAMRYRSVLSNLQANFHNMALVVEEIFL